MGVAAGGGSGGRAMDVSTSGISCTMANRSAPVVTTSCGPQRRRQPRATDPASFDGRANRRGRCLELVRQVLNLSDAREVVIALGAQRLDLHARAIAITAGPGERLRTCCCICFTSSSL
jgi:hypothetical protein